MLFGLRGVLGVAMVAAAALALIGVNPSLRSGPNAKPAQSAQPTAPSGPSLPAGAAPATTGGAPGAAGYDAEASHEQAQRLMKAVDAILQNAAKNRAEARKLPSDADYMLKPIWAETKEDRERKIRDILDAVLAIVTDAPIVDLQKKIEGLRRNIRELDDRIVALREKQLVAPKDGMFTSMMSDTVGSIGREIEESGKRIEANREEIAKAKASVREALKKNGVELTAEQVDLLLDGVLSGDLVRLVVVFNSAKLIDTQLGKLLAATGENIGAARKYFAMHAALFALLVHAQDSLIGKIDRQYLPKLSAIEVDIRAARVKTTELQRAENRDDQKRALDANAESQRLAEEAAKGYRRYLLQQREQVARAREKTTHDLRIADNTFETIEVSFQLRNLMRDASASFESIQKLEAPTFDQIFKNEELRREFENLTRKLDGPTS
jgi:polyhydroxyalkanoate synthesis regulator phasin